MGFERRRRASTVLNLTPLIDIVFLPLVFFMLTSHFIEDQADRYRSAQSEKRKRGH